MKRNYKISVAIATYNGEKYIEKQLDSILSQLQVDDEIIISDDGSMDNTLNIISNINDNRISIIKGPHLGVKQNFANAISKCSGKYIFLSDQDDIWDEKKVEKVLETFEKKKCVCILHDSIAFDSNSKNTIYNSFFEYRKVKKGIINNIIKNSYIGCCMAFDSELKKYILPIPSSIEMHDQWIGIIAEKKGKVVFLEDKLIKYRRHEQNVSNLKHYPFFKMLTNRMILVKELIKKGM